MQKLSSFLNKLSANELAVLHKILGTKNNNVEEITNAYSKLPLPATGLFQTKLSYEQILDKIASKNNIAVNSKNTIADKERDLFQKLFIKEFENLNDNEKQQFLNELEKNGLDKKQIASITSMAAITAAQVSGFGVYLLATSTVGAITGALGITLPFAFYTGLTSVISVVIGPIGFLVLGYGIYRSFKDVKSLDEAKEIFKQTGLHLKNITFGDMQKTEMVFKYIASMRLLKIKQEEDNVNETMDGAKLLNVDKSKINSEVEMFDVKIEAIETEMEALKIKVDELHQEINIKLIIQDELKSERQVLNDDLTKINQRILENQSVLNRHLKAIDVLKNN